MTDIIRPHKKLLTKQWLLLATISSLIALVVLLLQAFIPLGGEVSAGEIGRIAWPIAIGAIFGASNDPTDTRCTNSTVPA